MEYLESDFFLIALTFSVYFLAKRLQVRTGWVVLNPILLAILALIGFLKVTGISYETYAGSASIIDFWLKPAIVALGVPLYLQLKSIRRQLMPVLVSQLVGCFVGIVSVVLTAKWMGASYCDGRDGIVKRYSFPDGCHCRVGRTVRSGMRI